MVELDHTGESAPGHPASNHDGPQRRERTDPKEADGQLPAWFAGFSLLVVMLGVYWLSSEVPADASWAGDNRSPVATEELVELSGEAVYGAQCVACHQPTGAGVAGAFPPLAASPWVIEDLATPVRILLRGLQGEIEVAGKTYNGVMPAFGHLSDGEIARVVTYIRSQWGNQASPATEELVAELRASLAGQDGPWKGGAELAALRDLPDDSPNNASTTP